MRKIILVAGWLSLMTLANAQDKWTLQQCIDTALANNRNMKQKEIVRQTNEIAYEQARNNLLPNLNASLSHNFQWGRALDDNNTYTNSTSLTQSSSFGVGSSVTLFDGLKMKYNIDARMADLKSSESELEVVKRDIIMSVSTAYLQVLLNKELLQVADDQLQLTETKLEQQQKLVETGKLAQGELFEIQAQASKELLNKIQAENALKLSLLDLAQILELRDFSKLDIIVPEDLMSAELQLLDAAKVYENALANRPEIKSAEYSLDSKEKNVLISRSAYFPRLTLDASLGSSYYNIQGVTTASFAQQFSDKIGAGVGLTMTIPIFNKFETKNQIRTSKLEVESSKLNLENTKIELQKNIQQAYYNAIAAKAKWDAALKTEIAGKEAYRFAGQKFENSKATVYELYQAKSNLAQAESQVVQAKYEYIFRLKILELLQ